MVETVKAGTGKSALMMVLIAAIIIGAIVALILIPGALQSLVIVLAVIGIAIVAIIAVVFICMVVLAVPMYVAKGEEYQTNVSYGLDGVESVKEKDSEKDKPE